MSWAEDHRGIVIGAVAALIAVALVMLLVGRVRTTRNEAAGAVFRSAHDQFEAGKYVEAAEAFAELGREYPSTAFGRLAGLYRAHALARQGDNAGAASAYADFVAASASDGYIRQEALVGLGRAREATKDNAGALEAYTEAAALEGPFRTDARLGAARMHEAAGHAGEARTIYAELLKDAKDQDLRAFLATKVPAVNAE